MSLHSNHPGGLDLTRRMIGYARFSEGDTLLDIGCGAGQTVRFLRETCRLNAMGVDPALTRLREQADPNLPVWHGTACSLPFERESLHGILCECSFSLLDDPESALDGFVRVLKPGGRLLISDLYARARPAQISGLAKYLHTRETLCGWMTGRGLALQRFEDHSHALKAMVAQMIMDMGADGFYAGIGSHFDAMKAAQCGYYMLIAGKSTD
jgi:ubiquinone/menaquinone biosynthesis C-methylase UbiE